MRFLISSCILLSLLLISCGSNDMLKEYKLLDHYPSASGIEYFNNNYYIIGDDANNLLVLDSNLNPLDSIQLYNYPEKRIPKAVKPDLEAVLTTTDKKLMLLGSGSILPQRNIGWLFDPATKQKDSIRLDTLYARILQSGPKELNIEGAASIPGGIVLANRGNKSYPKNQLIFTGKECWKNQDRTPIAVVSLGGNTDTAKFSGVSGIDYCRKSDRLILTVSTEDTRSSHEDGAIGKSYLWIIENISSKKGWKAINPNQVIELDGIDPKFEGQKIESVCITKETRDFLHLVLVADNDNGSSSIFRLITEKK